MNLGEAAATAARCRSPFVVDWRARWKNQRRQQTAAVSPVRPLRAVSTHRGGSVDTERRRSAGRAGLRRRRTYGGELHGRGRVRFRCVVSWGTYLSARSSAHAVRPLRPGASSRPGARPVPRRAADGLANLFADPDDAAASAADEMMPLLPGNGFLQRSQRRQLVSERRTAGRPKACLSNGREEASCG